MGRGLFGPSFLIILTLLGSCGEDIDGSQKLYVVEAFIFAGEPVQGIQIKELTPLDSGSSAIAPVIKDANVNLEKSGISYSLEFDPVSETYFYPGNDLVISSGDLVKLEIDARGRSSYGETIVPNPPEGVRKNLEKLLVPEIFVTFDLRDRIIDLFTTARLTVEWDNEMNDLHYVVVENREEEIDPILPDIVPEEAMELLSSFRFISEPTEATSFDVIGVALETYGTHVVKVYRVNQEYADLFRNDTQDSRDLNAPPTNMVGAFGIFSSFSSDSVTFEVLRE